MSDISLTINETPVTVPKGTTILDAARELNIRIPTLCHLDLHDLKAVNQVASCRVCLVQIEGRVNLSPACATFVEDGMVVYTNTPTAILARRTMVELLLSDHPTDCLVCEKNRNCLLQQLAAELGVRGELKLKGEHSIGHNKDASSRAIYRNTSKCIMCRRCETMCNQVQTCGILSATHRGFGTVVQPAYSLPMNDTMCTFCGQCVSVCPTAALTEINSIQDVWDAIHNPDKLVVVQTAPAVRVALGECFGYEPGTIVTGKMVTLLRRLGFDKVFDTDFAADLTIIEEASELIHRIQHGGRFPILTSCCPAWVKFIEHQFPDLLDIPSSCKSPHEMMGVMVKTYYAEKYDIDPKNIVNVSIMPCVTKKYEASRKELSNDDLQNVDFVLTTRELAMMAREAGLDLRYMDEDEFDQPLGQSTGASVIFGVTGGVIEAALRTAYEWLTKTPLETVEFTQLRGIEGIREAKVNIGDREFTICIAHGLGNARAVLEAIRSGEKNYDAIEIMACPGGCVGGGGQPYHHGDADVVLKRAEAIYKEDRNKEFRKSHDNHDVIRIYEEYLGEFYGEKARRLLHTDFYERERL